MDQQDADMMRRWQTGDAGAFEKLVRRWQEPVGRFLFRLTGCAEQAADLCQDVFLRMYLQGSRYREQGSFSTWLYQLALNIARDAARRARHQPVPLDDVDPPAPTVAADCEYEELAQLTRRILAELPLSLREVL